jgi:hypothetical protein
MEVRRVMLAGDSVLHLVRVTVTRRSQGYLEYSFWSKPQRAGVYSIAIPSPGGHILQVHASGLGRWTVCELLYKDSQ